MFRSALMGTGLVALVVGAGALSYRVGFTQGAAVGVAQPEGEVDHDAVTEAYENAAKPGPQHAKLAEAAGKWKAHTEFSFGPDQVMEGDCTMSTKAILDGRFTMSHMEGDFAGAPFAGYGINGYDNFKNEYVGVWFDNMGTAIMYLTGNMEGDDLVMTGMAPTPTGGNPMKIVSSHPDKNTMVDTFYDKVGDEWVHTGTITYTRAD
ncbi:MAG: DUF1579 family protein [Phycisphaerales bacterium]